MYNTRTEAMAKAKRLSRARGCTVYVITWSATRYEVLIPEDMYYNMFNDARVTRVRG